jgi:hypothetical protein
MIGMAVLLFVRCTVQYRDQIAQTDGCGDAQGLISSSFRFCRATHLAHCPRQQHATMREANDLDHSVRAHAIDDDAPRTANALFLDNQTAPNAKRVNPDASSCGYLPGSLDDRERQPRQQKRTA